MSLRVKKEFKQELASTNAEKNESTEFLNLTNIVLQRCEEMINILESYSARVKQDVRNIEQKAKTIVTNFQCKLEGYIKCENIALMQRDQAQFISHNQGSLKSMADHIKSMIDNFCIFRDSYKSTLNLRQHTKGGLEILALKRSAAEKQHNRVEYELKSHSCTFKAVRDYELCTILASKQVVSFCENQGTSQIFYFQDGGLLNPTTLSQDIKFLAMLNDDKIAINNGIYTKEFKMVERLALHIENHQCIYYCEGSNTLYYGSAQYPYIARFDLQTRHKIVLRVKESRTKLHGIMQIESVEGMNNLIICLHWGKLFKFTLDLSHPLQNADACYKSTSDSILNFKLLPDNIHLVALTEHSNVCTIDHFTGEILSCLKTSITQQLYLHPKFSAESFPIVVGSNKQGQSEGVDCMESGIRVGNMIEGRIVCQIDKRHFVAYDDKRQNLCLLRIY